MASSYGKNTWFHQSVGLLSLLLLALSSSLLHSKETACAIPLLPREELSLWVPPPPSGKKAMSGTELSVANFRAANKTQIADEMVFYIEHYYEIIQYFHWGLIVWCCFVIALGWINIVPKQEDAKVFTILMTILIMGLMSLFALYAAFVAFHKPCKEQPAGSSGFSMFVHIWNVAVEHTTQWYEYIKVELLHTNSTITAAQHNATPAHSVEILNLTMFDSPQTTVDPATLGDIVKNYKLEFRATKDRRPVNVYEDEDDTMIYVVLINSSVGFIMLCSNFLFFFDSRQHMIEWRN